MAIQCVSISNEESRAYPDFKIPFVLCVAACSLGLALSL